MIICCLLKIIKLLNECQYLFHNISYHFYYIWAYCKDSSNCLLAFILLPSKNKVKRAFEDIFVCIPAAVNHDETLNQGSGKKFKQFFINLHNGNVHFSKLIFYVASESIRYIFTHLPRQKFQNSTSNGVLIYPIFTTKTCVKNVMSLDISQQARFGEV